MDRVNKADFEGRFHIIDAQLRKLYEEMTAENIQLSHELQDNMSVLDIEKSENRRLETENQELNQQIIEKDHKIARVEALMEDLRQKYGTLEKAYNSLEKMSQIHQGGEQAFLCDDRIHEDIGILKETPSQPEEAVQVIGLDSARQIAARTLYGLAEYRDTSWWKTVVSIINGFICSRRCGLYPLFCGYNALTIARMLVAIMDGEIPEMLILNPDFHDVASLNTAIRETSTHNIIIDGFDRIDPVVLLPILRKKYNKQLIFIAEDVQRIKIMPPYLLHYCALIVYDSPALKKQDSVRCYLVRKEANLRDIRVNPDGYKDWYTMLQDVHIDATYCHVRKYFFNCITPEKKSQQYRAAYRKAFDMYYQLELRWILDEQQATKLYNIFEHRVLT